jgi:hypothetical protein
MELFLEYLSAQRHDKNEPEFGPAGTFWQACPPDDALPFTSLPPQPMRKRQLQFMHSFST